jgi:hypothetical protein
VRFYAKDASFRQHGTGQWTAFDPSYQRRFPSGANRIHESVIRPEFISKMQRFYGLGLWKNVSLERQSVRIWNSRNSNSAAPFSPEIQEKQTLRLSRPDL